ncbi:putative butyrophilin subfamily 2 member A3 [Epinephelus moara]|uniref:putative butyrophilin subfamily 2 member A3 n=1 Tax=Epinephelus moara TaxID=300413 RepID=UPI00214E96B5|nr:putative butyrophilin subfamily 2 member A3 [Epinephelus moara]
MKLQLDLLCFCLLCFTGKTLCDEKGPAVIKVLVSEGSDVTLPCSLSTKENIEQKLFDWRKDEGMTGVFMYDKGLHHNNGRPGQDEQFKWRVFHFQDELKHGNASIFIRNTKMADSGNYTCVFPFVQRTEKSHVMLVVVSSPKPSVTVLNATNNGMQLQCEVHGASPKPKAEWKDSDGNILPAEETQVTDRGGSYDIILQTTVTKTDRYRCVVTQEEINHQIHAEIYVYIIDNSRSNINVKWLIAAAILAFFGPAAVCFFWWSRRLNKRIDREKQLQKFEHLMKTNVRRKAGCSTRTQTEPEDLQSCSGSKGSKTAEREKEQQPLNTGAHDSQAAAPPDLTS